MRILVCSPYLPWPLNSGGNAAQFSTLKCLAENHQFTLMCPACDDTTMANAKELQAQLPSVKVRAVFCGQPAESPPKRHFLVRLASWTVRTGRKWLNPPQPKASPASLADILHFPFNPLSEKFLSALGEEIAKGVDLFQAEFAEMMPLGAWVSEEIPKLFVHHQIHFVYAERFLKTHDKSDYWNYLSSVIKAQEIAYLKKFNAVITFSEEDRRMLLPYIPTEKLLVSAFPIPADVGIATELPAAFDGRFLFLASEDHLPNKDALEWLLAKIWPEILRQLPLARLVVIGQWSEAAKSKYAASGVEFAGFVKSLASVLRGGIMLVPLRIGSGIRVKIMVAMAQGAPVVSTSVGSEGMPVRDGEELLVRDDAFEFAAAAVQLAKDAEFCKRLAMAGQAAISKFYSPERVRQQRNEIYESLNQFQPNTPTDTKTPLVSIAY